MGEGKALIESQARELIIQHLVEKSPYLKGSCYPGVVGKVAQFVVQVKQNNLSADELTDRILTVQQNKLLGEKDNFLLGILNDYQEFLDKKAAIDQEDTTGWLSESLKNKKSGLLDYLSGYQTVILDGFYYLSPAQQELVRSLINFFPQTIVTLHTKSLKKLNHDSDSAILEKYVSFIHQIYSSVGGKVEQGPSSGGRSAIFFDDPDNRVEEVRKIARAIKAILLEKREISPDRIGVVFPSLEIYAPLIHEIFPQYGIPYQLPHKLSRSPLAHAFKKMLDLRCNGFLLEDLEEFFSYGFIAPRFTQEGRVEFFSLLDLEQPLEAGFDFAALVGLCRKANISGGDDFLHDWWEPIQKYLESKDSRESAGTKTGSHRAKIGNTLFYLNQLHSFLWKLPDTLTPQRFQDIILELADLMQIPQNLLLPLEQPDHRNLEAIKHDIAAFNRIRDVSAEIVNHLRFLDRKEYPLSMLGKIFLRYLARSTFFPPTQGKNIAILNLSETIGLSFDTVFMGGLVEGELPLPGERDIFYPTGGGKIYRWLDRTKESKYLFYGLLNNSHGPIYFFSPQASDERVLFPSSLIDPDWRRRQDSENIYSRQELLENIALTRDQPQKSLELKNILQQVDPGTSAQINRVLQIEQMRSSSEVSPFEGVLADPDNLIRLKERYTFTADNSCHYSVSQLEEYARCPMQYFFDRILELKPLPPVQEEIEADERGKLVHQILEEYYRGVSKEELSDQDTLRQRLILMANHVFDRWAPPFHNAFWEGEKRKLFSGLDSGEKPGILLRFWLNEQEQLKISYPYLVEFSFGEEKDYFCIDELRLVGRIDRIDRLWESDSFLFFDYKTGKIPDLEDINKGLSFQIPVYLMALADYFDQQDSVKLTTGVGGYYAVSDREVKLKTFYGSASVEHLVKSRRNSFFNNSELQEELHSIRIRIHQIDRSIKEGKFPLPQIDPADVPCKWCDFKKICRWEGTTATG
jgi:ATP-dependent helicase/DNAse subunit B